MFHGCSMRGETLRKSLYQWNIGVSPSCLFSQFINTGRCGGRAGGAKTGGHEGRPSPAPSAARKSLQRKGWQQIVYLLRCAVCGVRDTLRDGVRGAV